MIGIRSGLFLGLALFAILFSRAADQSVVQHKVAQLQGEWSLVAWMIDGQRIPAEKLALHRVVYDGLEVTTMMNGHRYFTEKISIDPSSIPPTIDYTLTRGSTPHVKLGIYELSGDMFKLCIGRPGAKRPTDFSTKQGDGRTLQVWRRKKSAGSAGDSK